ncbi:MAG: DUF4340 domain-containing protein [Pseudomonadales bacterium]|nr:DUF4340 domain-containing protein [Pseudomonadales bacterium]
MLNSKTLGLTVLAILVMAMAAYLGQRQSETGENIGQPVLPGLQENLERLQRVEIRSHDAGTTLIREDAAWQVEQRDGYPVDFPGLAALLDSIREARYEEKKTSRPDNFAVLGLQDIDENSSKAVLVRLSTGDDQYALMIGERGSGGRGQLVRKPDEQQVWLVNETIEVDADPVGWLDPVIIDVAEEEIESVRYTNGEEILEVRRSESGEGFEVANLPTGEALRYPTVADQLARALVNVRLKDVRRAGALPADTAMATFDLAGERQVTVNAWQEDERHFLAFERSGGEEQRDLSAWHFEVSNSTFDKFTRTMADMIKADEEGNADSGGSS